LRLPRILLLLAAAALLSSCVVVERVVGVRGSGDLVTQDVEVQEFTGIEASNAFEVDVVVGERERVQITVDDNIVPLLDVTVEGDTLTIGLKDSSRVQAATLRAAVTAPADLASVAASGAAKVDVTGTLEGDALALQSSGAGRLSAGVETRGVQVNASGASRVVLSGNAETVQMDISGASTLSAFDLTAGAVSAQVSGASTAEVTATETISGEVSGASTLRYRGEPGSADVESSGASTVGAG
jgi:hypothetical protein